MNRDPQAKIEERRFHLEEGLKVALVVFSVLGITTQIEQPGVVAGFAAILAGLAEQPGSLRKRTWDLSAFAILGLAPMVFVAAVGSNPPALLALLFIMTAAFTWMSGYGERLSHVGWVLTIWTTLVMGFRVWESAPVSYLGYACGSLLVVFAALVPPILCGSELASATDGEPLNPSRCLLRTCCPGSRLALFLPWTSCLSRPRRQTLRSCGSFRIAWRFWNVRMPSWHSVSECWRRRSSG